MEVKIAVIADTHSDNDTAISGRRVEIADILFLRAVHRLNRMIKPDVTLVLGDLIDRGGGPGAAEQLQRMGEIVDLLKSPTIAIPGNHDGDPDEFYRFFERPGDFIDIKGIRFVPFLDPEEPGYNARRTPSDLERMARARTGFDGSIISVQHVPLFPPGMSNCPYNFTNVDEVIQIMRKHGICLAVSGHFHPGMDLIRSEGMGFVAAPALCESPFAFLEIAIEGENIEVLRHELRMPAHLELVDPHIHTQFAYCGENMEVKKAMSLAEDFGLRGMAFGQVQNSV